MKEKNGEHPFGDTGQLILLVLFLLIWVVDSFFLRISTFLSAFYLTVHSLGHPWTITSGCGLSYPFRSCCRQSWTAPFRRGIDRRLPVCETSAVLREHHVLSWAIGIDCLAIFSRAGGGDLLIFYNHIASYEEKILAQQFGEEYRNYKKRRLKHVSN